jgi:hypothetical protein
MLGGNDDAKSFFDLFSQKTPEDPCGSSAFSLSATMARLPRLPRLPLLALLSLAAAAAAAAAVGPGAGAGAAAAAAAGAGAGASKTKTQSGVAFTGYVVDSFCWDKTPKNDGGSECTNADPMTCAWPAHSAPPAGCVDLARNPERHTLECIREIPVCLYALTMLARDEEGTGLYGSKYAFKGKALLALQQLMCDQESTQTDASKQIPKGMCRDGTPDYSVANGGHALGKIAMVDGIADPDDPMLIVEASFQYKGETWPKTVVPAFAVTVNGNQAVCPAKGKQSGCAASMGNKMTMAVLKVTETDITVKVTYDAPDNVGWFALGVNSAAQMQGTDAMVCQSGVPNTVQRIVAGNHALTGDSENMPAAAGNTCVFDHGKGTMTFTRKVGASEGKGHVAFQRNALTTFVWASGPTAKIAHHADKNSLQLNVDSCGGGTTPQVTPLPGLIIVHAVCMLLGWGILLPWGAALAVHFKSSKYLCCGTPLWFGLHRIMMPIGWLLQLIGFACILVQKSGTQFQAANGTGTAHVWIGLFVVVLGSLNPLVAAVRPHPVDEATGQKSQKRKVWEIVHKYVIGWPTVVFGVLNCVLAVAMLLDREYNYSPWLPTFVLFVVVLEFIAVCWASFATAKPAHESHAHMSDLGHKAGSFEELT